MSEHDLSARTHPFRLGPLARSRVSTSHPAMRCRFECVDASGGQVTPGMTLAEYLRIDRTRIHALTGPLWIEGAEPGDVLQVDVLSTRHCGWGWTSIVEGLGFLKDRFHEPYLFHWLLEGDSTRSLLPGGRACAAIPRRHGRSARRRRQLSHPSPRPLRRQPRCARTLRRIVALSAGLQRRRALQLRRWPRGTGRWRGLHQRHRVPARRDAALQSAQAVSRSPALSSKPANVLLPTPPLTPGSLSNLAPTRRNCARRNQPHDRSARQPLGIQRGPCLSALQRGSQAAPQPGCQRAHVYRQRRHQQTDPAGQGALSTRMTINDPDVIAELEALYPEYEHALVTNDVEKLVAMFWAWSSRSCASALPKIFTDQKSWKHFANAPAANLARTVKRLDIVSFGRDFASITLEFERDHRRQDRARPTEPGVGALSRRLAHRAGPCLATCPEFAESAPNSVQIARGHRHNL